MARLVVEDLWSRVNNQSVVMLDQMMMMMSMRCNGTRNVNRRLSVDTTGASQTQ